MNKHIEISVSIDPLWAEYVSDLLINKIGCSGTVLEETTFERGEFVSSIINVVKGYMWLCEKSLNIQEIQNILWLEKTKLLASGDTNNLGSWNISVKDLDNEEWAHSWKKFWKPQKIGSKIVICPSWEHFESKNDEIKINLDPGTAFGTGTHPTTRLCVKALEQHVLQNDTIADVGMGSGILSIVGTKLGAKSVVGVDNDASVIEVAKENAEKNNTTEQSLFYEGSAVDIKGQYDIVVANILAHVLIEMMNELVSLMKKSGKLILSGILVEKRDDVIESAQQNGLSVIEVLEEDDWVAIVVGK